jgi:RHS repeat-associated protein
VTDANGVKVAEHAYYPLGAEINLTLHESPEEAMKFTGHERDIVAGDGHTLDYMHARYYSASVGRFLSVDPLIKKGAMGSPQLWNRYAYTANNPMNRIDPDGRNWFSIDGTWEWHKGAKYTHDGHTYNSNYTHLLVAQAVGTTRTGATQLRLTLYDQNHVAATGSYFSGGGGHMRIPMGNYTIRGEIKDPNGPTEINPNSPLKNPPIFYGMQVIRNVPLHDSSTGNDYDVFGAYGPMRAYLNPWDPSIPGSTGNYLHGQAASGPSAHGYTHGCLCYGQDTTIINSLWKLGERVPVSVDGSVQQP